jgi:hypothetical protein
MDEKFTSFLELFSGRHTIQTFDDRQVDKSLAAVIHFEGRLPAAIAMRLQRMNACGAGIHFCVNETDGNGRKAANVVRIRAVFADLDGAPLDAALEYKPSLIVESSPGKYHCYWHTYDTPVSAFSVVQKNIARALNSDPIVHDLPRVMRVPGFYHNKGTPFMARVHGGSGYVCSYRDLVAWFPPERVKQFSSKRYRLEKKVSGTGDFRGLYGAGYGERNAHVMKRIGGMLKRGCDWAHITAEAYREGMACSPPLGIAEIDAILKSAQRYKV